MKPVLISKNRPVGLGGLLVLFFIMLVVLWFVIDHYSLLGMLSAYFNYPLYLEYAVFVVSSWLMAFVLYALIKKLQLMKMHLIIFSVKMSVDENYYYVAAPSGMLASEFLTMYFNYLLQTKSSERYRKILNSYVPFLEIKRNNEQIKVAATSTLVEAGLIDGDICQVVGKSKAVNV